MSRKMRSGGGAGPLTAKEKLFVEHYLRCKDAAKAVRLTGYAGKRSDMAGHRMMDKANVRAAIAKAVEAQASRLELTADRILTEFLRVGLCDVGQAFDENGRLKEVRDMPEDVRRAVSGLDVEEIWQRGPRGQRTQIGELKKIRFWNKNEALTALGKHLRLFVESLELKVDNLTDEQKAARVEALLAAARARKEKADGG